MVGRDFAQVFVHNCRKLLSDISPVSKLFTHKNEFIFQAISFNTCYGCSKEPSHGDGSFEYPQHVFG